ncbi:hypothetical protein [Rhodopirellula europaea]|jgi:hypothetical protein|nr:hypothetical protein [Rhodopirellula europaea]MCR9119678.1 hypothetical protein [bacterium]
MNWIDFAFRLPYLIALAIGVVVCIAKCGKHRRPAILAACGFGIALIQSLSFPFIYSTLGGLFDDPMLGQGIASVGMSTLSAVHVGLLLSAIFATRQTTTTPMNVSEQDLAFAMTQLEEGASIHQIEERLAERGLAPSGVASVIHAIEVEQSHKAGWRNLVLGGVICALGILATVVSYSIAANAPGGGRYIVTYGLILAGGAQAIRGLIQVGK